MANRHQQGISQPSLFDPPPPAPPTTPIAAGSHRIAAYIKCHRQDKAGRSPIPTVCKIAGDVDSVYTPVTLELPSDYYLGNNGFGVECIRRVGYEEFFTAYALVKAGVIKVIAQKCN